ncbi:MAG: hypothetical protein R3F19_13530 [Verrucomicrobiales bacterium]
MKIFPKLSSISKFLSLMAGISAVASVGMAAPPEYRDWTIGGEGSIRAKFVPSTGLGDTITLEEASGKTKIVAFPKISPPDQEYVDLWVPD